MKSHSISRQPELESVRDDLNRLKLTWGLCCASPILYLLFSRFIQDTFFASNSNGFAHLPQNQYYIAIGIAGVLVLGLQVAMLVLRRRYQEKMRNSMKHPQQLLRMYSRRTFQMMLISEVAVVLGFVLFLLNGQASVVFAFGIATMLYYAQSYPSERALSAVVQGH